MKKTALCICFLTGLANGYAATKSAAECERELGTAASNRKLVSDCILRSMNGEPDPVPQVENQSPPAKVDADQSVRANSMLLEACNSIDDKDKRLSCLKELSELSRTSAPANSAMKAAADRVKNAFASVSGAVNSGISYNNYSSLILEPAKELEIFKQSNPKPNQVAISQFEEALVAYRDAATVWHASIFKSDDGGLFLGKILNPQYTGLQGIVNKYDLPVKQIVLTQHLSAEIALPIIWRYALEHAQAAAKALDAPETNARIPNGGADSQLLDPLKSSQGSIPTPTGTSSQSLGAGASSDPKPVLYDGVSWIWPVNGEVLRPYDPAKKRNIEIGGKPHDPILAVADGEVVSRSERDLAQPTERARNIIIIKHKNGYMSLYSDNKNPLVKKGDMVTMGQKISEMGISDGAIVKLTFTLIKDSKTIDPMTVWGAGKP